jgi:quinohemoprotein ethanol dehydrogenase
MCALGLMMTGLSMATIVAVGGETPARQTVNWTDHNGGSDEQAYSSLDQISIANIQQLGLKWSLELPGEHMLEATPLAVDGVLFFTGGHSKVYAVNAVTGKLLWTYDPEVWNHDPQKMQLTLPVNRGAAYAEGRLFVSTVDGRLFALDTMTGKLLWSVATTPFNPVQSITGAPRVFNGKVIIGQGGADRGARGYVTAYDQKTGKQVWRTFMTPGSPEENRGDPAMERAAATWSGEFWKTGTGGGAWDSITFDRELNYIYVGTGNAGKVNLLDPEGHDASGDKLYTASIVALDADTGKYVWHYQINPRETWDFDCTQQMLLANLMIDGRTRKVLMQAPKNGFLYVLDRSSGKIISTGKIGKVTWAESIDPVSGRPLEADNVRFERGTIDLWPNMLGAHSWQTMSYSPKTGLTYIPYMQSGMRFGSGLLETVKVDAEDEKGALLAYDPVKQKIAWKVQHQTFWNGGTLATAGGLVFQGTADGFLSAYDASSGKQVWRFDAKLGIIAAPMAYSVGGRQYVSVLVGYGASNAIGNFSNVGWKYGIHPRRLLTFALGGRAALPPMKGPDLTLSAVDDPSMTIDQADVRAGTIKYLMNCIACHGNNAIAAGVAPDLRESQVALKLESFSAVVRDGVLLERGMPRFDNLSPTDVRQIHAFVRAKARAALHAGS